MRALGSTSLLLMIAASIAGCGDNRRITNVDGGRPPPPPVDGGSCPPGTICLMDSGPPDPPPFDAGSCVPSPESSAQACGDFRDNDCDLQIDCNDVGCCPFIFCDPGTLCGNMARDAGPPPRDSGPAVCGGVEFLDDVLPPACLPRCRASTFTALEACTTAACVDSTLEGDLTPSVQYDLNGMVRELDCAECFGWQLGSCRAQNCPTEYVAYVECVRMTGGACTTQFNAVVACQQSAAVAEDFNTCFDTQVVGGCS